MGEGRGERHGGVYQHTPLNRERKGEERVEDILAAGSNMESKIHSHTHTSAGTVVLTLKSSMSSSCREPAGDGVADKGCS